MLNKLRCLFFCFIFLNGISYSNEIAITFDDLPGAPDNKAAIQEPINRRILNTLLKYKVPAIGFVNEDKIYSNKELDKKIALLKLWTDNGFDLGNHTYSHRHLSNLTTHQFQSEVIKGEIESKKLMNDAGRDYHYFRHPFLDTGATPQIRSASESFLKKEGYHIAPVTIDTDDWKFNQQLLERPEEKNKIIQAYLEHTRIRFAFYEDASKHIFGRNIKQIWLLHVNLINSYTMKQLLTIAKDFDYNFISLGEALRDEAYDSENNYYSHFGVSWLYRWDYTRGKVVDWSKEIE